MRKISLRTKVMLTYIYSLLLGVFGGYVLPKSVYSVAFLVAYSLFNLYMFARLWNKKSAEIKIIDISKSHTEDEDVA